MGLVCSTVDCVAERDMVTGQPIKHHSNKQSNNLSFNQSIIQSTNQRGINLAWLDEDAMKTTQPTNSVATSVVSSPRHSIINQHFNFALKHDKSINHSFVTTVNNHSTNMSISGTESPQTSPSDNQTTNQPIKQLTRQSSHQRHFPRLQSFEEHTEIAHSINQPITSTESIQQTNQSINEIKKSYHAHQRSGSEGFVIRPSTKRHSSFVPNKQALQLLQRQSLEKVNNQSNNQLINQVEAKTLDSTEQRKSVQLFASHEQPNNQSNNQSLQRSPPRVSLHAIEVQPDTSPLDLGPSADQSSAQSRDQSKTQVLNDDDDASIYEPVDTTIDYNGFQTVDSPLVYQAIRAYHKEHQDEGLGPSWYSINQLNNQTNNQSIIQRVIHIQSHDQSINQSNNQMVNDLTSLKSVTVDQPCSILGFLNNQSISQTNNQTQHRKFQRC